MALTVDARAGGPAAERLVGRDVELGSLELALNALDQGHSGSVELAGEAGIGKTRLLRELAARAEARGHLVLTGAAAELEHDLPFSVFVDALDQYLAGLDPKLVAALDPQVQAELGHVFPSQWALAGGREVAPQHERYRSHRAVRALLELLAKARPLVLVLDDFHWADSGSVELVAALLRRPPAAAVLLAVALRPRHMPERFAAAFERAHRAATLTRIELAPLTPREARTLLDDAVDEAGAAVLYEVSGGNPFYLEQLARVPELTCRATGIPEVSLTGMEVPRAVVASLGEELALLSDRGRRVLDGAAVAGDPFEAELAAAAAGTSEASTMHAIDELLELDLIRPTDVPRRFQFRHPLVRRAIYDTAPAGWRIRAHARCAEALVARGAAPTARAHHVERSARQGEVAAIAVLREAGEATSRLAPESAARWFGAALRLLPQTAPADDRVELLLVRAGALAAAGHFAASHEALLETIEIIPEQASALMTTAATSCAGLERILGRYEQAHERLVRVLGSLPERASAETVGLLIELTVNEFYRSRYDAMREWAERAVDAAAVPQEPALMAAALAIRALAHAMTGPLDEALSYRAEAAAFVDELTDAELSARLDAPGWLAAAELYLDHYPEADVHASRVLALTRAAGRGDPFFRLYQILPRVWYVRGRLAEAAVLLDDTIEGVRLLGTPPSLAGNLFNRSVVALAAGDLDIALSTAEEAAELTRDLDQGFVTAWAAVRLASVVLESGQPGRAVQLLLNCAGGEELTRIPGGWRVYCLELLTRGWLGLDRRIEAERAAALAHETAAAVGLPLAGAWADRSAAAVALATGDVVRAAERALASADGADAVGAPIEAALARTLAGRALAQAGQRERAIAELQSAAAALDACGAFHYRMAADHELGKLGHRPHRRTRPGSHNGSGIATLTAREMEIARLVVDRRTNPEIAAELFLSPKTVETHLRNIFNKMDVDNRVALARAVERADRAAAG